MRLIRPNSFITLGDGMGDLVSGRIAFYFLFVAIILSCAGRGDPAFAGETAQKQEHSVLTKVEGKKGEQKTEAAVTWTMEEKKVHISLKSSSCEVQAGSQTKEGGGPNIAFGQTAVISVDDMPFLKEKLKNGDAKPAWSVNGKVLKKTEPELKDNEILFYPVYHNEDAAVWNDLYAKASGLKNQTPIKIELVLVKNLNPVKISVTNKVAGEGQKWETSETTESTEATAISTTVSANFRFYLPIRGLVKFGIAIVAFVAIIFVFAVKSNLFRDSTSRPLPGRKKTFSLARVQMGIWWVTIAMTGGWMFYITNSFFLTSQMWILIGMSTGTLVAGSLIDGRKATAENINVREAGAEKAKKGVETEQVITGLQSFLNRDKPSVDTKQIATLIEQTTKLHTALTAVKQGEGVPGSTEGVVQDILTDAAGAAVPRFQYLAATLGCAGFALLSVFGSLSMPEFSDSTLALMGISSGAYVGLKVPEKH